MKKTLSLLMAFSMIASILCLPGCGKKQYDARMIGDASMYTDKYVSALFENSGRATLTYVEGTFYLYSGSSTNQTPIKRVEFTWIGTCEPGETFSIGAQIDNPPKGLASAVNRIGYSIRTMK